MNTNDLNTALYEKMAAEQEQYRDWLKSQPPEEILHHAYEYCVREDIVMVMEEAELTDAQAQALLDSPSPLADVYRYFEKLETAHMDVVRDSIENRADDVTVQKVSQQSVLLEQAKELIDDFCQSEYGSCADFSDPTAIGIAYTTLTDDEIPIQVNVDLEHFRIDRFLDDKALECWQYSSLDDLVENVLENLNFEDLISVTDQELELVQLAGEAEISRDANDSEPEKQGVCPVYRHSAAYASEYGELEQYRASNRVNFQCKEAIEAAVREHFDGMHLDKNAAKGVIQTFGLDRVMLVLANTVQLHDWDGRYSPRNKEWAKTIPNYNSDTVRCGYVLNSHTAVLDGFISLVREEQQRSHTKGEKTQQPRASVRDKLKQEPPAHKPAPKKKREQER